MKKLLTSIVLVAYLAVTSGVIINSHYCMNRLASTQLFAGEKRFCGKCGMHTKKSNGCCHDKVTVVKLVMDQNTTPAISYELPALAAIANSPSDFIAASLFNFNVNRHFHNHSPPLLSAQDTYLQNNVFRI